MTTITRERLLKIQQWSETYGAGSNVMLPAEEAEELARIALASLEAKPVAYMSRQNATLREKFGTCDEWDVHHQSVGADFPLIEIPESDDYEIMPLHILPPAPVVPEGLVKAVRFYEQVKRENPPVETGAWKDAVDWVLKEACKAVSMLESSREHEVISQQEKA
ncbi:hypothetical protein BH212_19775 [Salmonella enterica]|nr:hypothetical protein [Salmonella enterica]